MTKASPWWDCNAWKLGYCSWIQNLFCSMVLWVWRALAVTRYRAFVATSPDCSTSERNSKTARTSTTARVTWIKMNHESNIRNLHTDNDIFGFWWFFHPWKIKHPCNFTNNGKANLPTKNSLETWPFPFGKKRDFFQNLTNGPGKPNVPHGLCGKRARLCFILFPNAKIWKNPSPLRPVGLRLGAWQLLMTWSPKKCHACRDPSLPGLAPERTPRENFHGFRCSFFNWFFLFVF